jgi:hypothetical protein
MKAHFILADEGQTVQAWIKSLEATTRKYISVDNMRFEVSQDGYQMTYFGRPDEIPPKLQARDVKITKIIIGDDGEAERPASGTYRRRAIGGFVTHRAASDESWALELRANVAWTTRSYAGPSKAKKILVLTLNYYDDIRGLRVTPSTEYKNSG